MSETAAVSPLSSSKQSGNKRGKKGRPPPLCRDGENCKIPNCRFGHPEREQQRQGAAAASRPQPRRKRNNSNKNDQRQQQQQQQQEESTPSLAGTDDSSPSQPRSPVTVNDVMATTTTTDTSPKKNGSNNKKDGSTKKKGKCKFGKKCNRKNCPFQHPPGREAMLAVVTTNDDKENQQNINPPAADVIKTVEEVEKEILKKSNAPAKGKSNAAAKGKGKSKSVDVISQELTPNAPPPHKENQQNANPPAADVIKAVEEVETEILKKSNAAAKGKSKNKPGVVTSQERTPKTPPPPKPNNSKKQLKKPKQQKPCKYGEKCRNRGSCKFWHPPADEKVPAVVTPSPQSTESASPKLEGYVVPTTQPLHPPPPTTTAVSGEDDMAIVENLLNEITEVVSRQAFTGHPMQAPPAPPPASNLELNRRLAREELRKLQAQLPPKDEERRAAQRNQEQKEKQKAARRRKEEDRKKAEANQRSWEQDKAAAELRRLEQERAAAEKRRLEQERAASEKRRLEQERLAAEKRRLEQERAAAEERRLEKEKAEAERRRQEAEADKAEAMRLEAEKRRLAEVTAAKKKLQEEQEAKRRAEQDAKRKAAEEAAAAEKKRLQEEREEAERKAKRKAAKKLRQRKERFESALDRLQDASNTALKKHALDTLRSVRQNAIDKEHEEKEAEKRRQQEARRQLLQNQRQSSKSLSKKEKKAKRREEFEKKKQEKGENRQEFWGHEMEREIEYTQYISRLCVAEFVRLANKNPFSKLTRVGVESNEVMMAKVTMEAQQAYYHLFEKEIKTRFKVDGDNGNLNGRFGSIRYWDADKSKYCCGLDTKKGRNEQEVFLKPSDMDQNAPEPHERNRKGRKHEPKYVISFTDNLFGVQSFSCTVHKGEVNKMAERSKVAGGIDKWLDMQMQMRDEEERFAQEQFAEERRREEEDRKRRAERRRREQEEWEERQRAYAEAKARYEEERREAARNGGGFQRGPGGFQGGGFGGGFRGSFGGASFRSGGRRQCATGRCNCRECLLSEILFAHIFAGRSGGASFRAGPSFGDFFFTFGGDSDDEYYDDDDEYDWDDRFYAGREREQQAKDESAAEVLGLDLETTSETEIKRAYRQLARRYHPDKFREDNPDGMTLAESEDKFKEIQNAYDRLLDRFDDDE